MGKKAKTGIMLTLLLTIMLTLSPNIQMAKAEPKIWTVDDDRVECPDADYTSIQDAIDMASSGDTACMHA